MTKWIALALAVILIGLAAWGIFAETPALTIVVDGQEMSGSWKGAIGIGGMMLAFVASLCAATLLLFVFAGVWIIVLGLIIVGAMIFAAGISPLLLSLLVPLAIVWAFVALVKHKSGTESPRS